MSNILLVTNNENIIETFSKKLVLLRSSDRMSCCDYEDAPDIVFANHPDIVILHEQENFDKTLNLIKYIKTQNGNVLLLIDKYSRDNILNAYDNGIDDYFAMTSDPSEILIRIINCIKKQNTGTKIYEYENQLKKYGILSETSGFYSRKYASEICENELLTKNYTKGALAIITTDETSENAGSNKDLIHAIRNAVRFNDLVVNLGNSKFCVINKTAGISGAVSIIDKIKNNLKDECVLRAGICEIKKYTFIMAEKKAQCALSDALLTNQDVVVYAKQNSEYDEDWLDVPAATSKNYKIFKLAFEKKLEKVIAPVFYRIQKDYETQLKNTKIEQYTDELQSIFRLTSPKQTSLMKLVYPGMTKVNIYLTHAGLDSPENSEISLHVNKLTQQNLTEILETFISEFKTTIE